MWHLSLERDDIRDTECPGVLHELVVQRAVPDDMQSHVRIAMAQPGNHTQQHCVIFHRHK